MSKFMLLKQAAAATGHPEYRLRQWCIQGVIRYNRAGNRYIINLDWLEQDLERMATSNIKVADAGTNDYGQLRKIK